MSRSTPLQIISDIHLEFLEHFPYIPVKAPILALLGDIGYPSSRKYKLFIQDLSARFQHVIILAGNHEFYDKGNYYKIINRIKKVCGKYSNVYFLNNSSIVINNQIFIGATLWGHIPVRKWGRVMRECNDYSQIKIKDNTGETRLLHPKDTTQFYNKSINYLKKIVTPDSIVFTHHAPSLHQKVIAPNDLYLEPCWSATEVKLPVQPKFWGYGHTHHPADFVSKGTRYYSNPIGDEPLDISIVECRYSKVINEF